MLDLKQNIQFIKGVGPNRVKLLNKLGIYTLEDLITYYPREYEDRGKVKKIANITDGEEALIEGVAVSKITENRIRRNMVIYKLVVRDDTGTCIITWFNQSYLKNKFFVGKKYKFFGKVSNKLGRIEMNSPVYEEADKSKNTGKIIPIYPLTFKLTQNTIRQIIENGLDVVKKEGGLEESIPEYILSEFKLRDINSSNIGIHFPKNFEDFKSARNRLVFEELFSMQLGLISLKNRYKKDEEGISFDKKIKISDVINELPFKLTKAQLRVLEEIDGDMESSKPMNRLLQGDVGSRKNGRFNNCCI